MQQFTERYTEKIRGVLSCLDRIVITGTIPRICFAEGMTGYLYQQGIRIFDYPQWAAGLREEIRANAEKIASKNGLEIEFIRKNTFRKEDRIKKILQERGNAPGLVHIFSAMEPCASYKPWHDKKTHKTYLRPDDGKCQHCYVGVDVTVIDAIGVGTVEVILSEYGPDLSRFPTEKQFVQHATLARHKPTSGGKAVKNKRRHNASTRVAAALGMAPHRCTTAKRRSAPTSARLRDAQGKP